VLIFIGTKIILGDFVWDGKMPAEISLAVTASLLAGGVIYSLWKTRDDPQPLPHAPAPQPSGVGMRACEIMTSSFVSIGPDASIGEAATLMAASGTSGLVVFDGAGKPLGIITEGDLIRREALGHAPGTSVWRTLFTDDKTLARAFAKAYGRRVAEVMSRDLKTVGEDLSVSQAAELLYTAEVKRLPVVRDARVVGILSRSDVIRALGRLGTELGTEVAPDQTIADTLRARLARAGWISPQQVRFSVSEGSVEVAGIVTSEDQRLALHALAEGVAGVTTIIDRLTVTTALLGEDGGFAR